MFVFTDFANQPRNVLFTSGVATQVFYDWKIE
jgi:hypothetical protein